LNPPFLLFKFKYIKRKNQEMVKKDEWKFLYWDEPIEDKENKVEVEDKPKSKPKTNINDNK